MPSEATTTIMFTDIVSSTALTVSLGDRASREVFGVHDALVRRQTADHGGYEVKAMGDGFMLAFASARRGVACASAIQSELERVRQEQDVPKVRIGLSVGEPIAEEGDLFGMSVITAARVSACAGADQVLVSELVYGLVVSCGDFAFSPIAPVEIKGLKGEQKLYELHWQGASDAPAGT
jgi:class 3 adenylate cyclase